MFRMLTQSLSALGANWSFILLQTPGEASLPYVLKAGTLDQHVTENEMTHTLPSFKILWFMRHMCVSLSFSQILSITVPTCLYCLTNITCYPPLQKGNWTTSDALKSPAISLVFLTLSSRSYHHILNFYTSSQYTSLIHWPIRALLSAYLQNDDNCQYK